MYTCNFNLIIILWTWSTLYFRTCLTDSINDIMTPHIRRHNLKHLKAERIYAIREDILAKLGYDESNMPDKRKFDSHLLRQRLRDYRKQLIERNHTHVLFSEKEFAAKTYHKILLSNCKYTLRVLLAHSRNWGYLLWEIKFIVNQCQIQFFNFSGINFSLSSLAFHLTTQVLK